MAEGMKHKVSELSGALLDAAVGKALGWERQMCEGAEWWWAVPRGRRHDPTNAEMRVAHFQPSTEWRDGGPIIDRKRILFGETCGGEIGAKLSAFSDEFDGIGATHLMAAMRACVASELGEEVELP